MSEEEEEKKSWNIVPGIDDMEYVEMFNLDPSVAYTPEINEAILKSVWHNNYTDAVAEGLPEDEAKAQADKLKLSGQMTVDKALKDRGDI